MDNLEDIRRENAFRLEMIAEKRQADALDALNRIANAVEHISDKLDRLSDSHYKDYLKVFEVRTR